MELAAGITASWTVSLLRMGLLATILAPALAFPLAGPIGAAVAVATLATALFYRRSTQAGTESPLALEDPFDLKAILQFCILLAAVMLAAKLLSHAFGEGGLVSLAAVSGLADVDPITLSMAKMTGSAITADYAALVILTAGAANLVAKCVLAIVFGGPRFSLPLIATAVLLSLAAGSVLAVRG
jgi:uncharacterized membrane protein (DUF4010 family)